MSPPPPKTGLKEIGEFIENYGKLEYIGLAKNGINSLDPLKELFSRIGKRPLSVEELAAYREKEKEREAVVSRAIKNKKKITEELYPSLEPLI